MKKNNGRGPNELASKGRGGDTEIGHLTEGELVVPVSILGRFPEARDALFDAFREDGIDPDRYIVGAEENSVNPETGVREFNFESGPGGYSDVGGIGSDDNDGVGGTQGPNSQDAGGRDKDPFDRNRSRSGGSGGGRMTLPSEYADFILADGRRLEDVLGKSFFKGFGKDGRHGKRDKGGKRARVLAERQAQAKRLNQTRSILTGAQGVAGAANTSRGQLSSG